VDGEQPSQEEATMGNGQRPKDKGKPQGIPNDDAKKKQEQAPRKPGESKDKPKDPRREQLRQER
jgi:hypothetical protein